MFYIFLLSLYYYKLNKKLLVSIKIKNKKKYKIKAILNTIDSRKKY